LRLLAEGILNMKMSQIKKKILKMKKMRIMMMMKEIWRLMMTMMKMRKATSMMTLMVALKVLLHHWLRETIKLQVTVVVITEVEVAVVFLIIKVIITRAMLVVNKPSLQDKGSKVREGEEIVSKTNSIQLRRVKVQFQFKILGKEIVGVDSKEAISRRYSSNNSNSR
jgi:hypothetical protein